MRNENVLSANKQLASNVLMTQHVSVQLESTQLTSNVLITQALGVPLEGVLASTTLTTP
jgi:hypothetical protein